jgi:hypothetical protein
MPAQALAHAQKTSELWRSAKELFNGVENLFADRPALVATFHQALFEEPEEDQRFEALRLTRLAQRAQARVLPPKLDWQPSHDARLEFAQAIALIYAFDLWKIRPETYDQALPLTSAADPVVSAYLRYRNGSSEGLSTMHAFSLAGVARAPLGFARLVLEEARAGARFGRDSLGEIALLLDDPCLRHEAEDHFFDLRARNALYLAELFAQRGAFAEWYRQMKILPELIQLGTGDLELQATYAEVRARLALREGRKIAAGGHLERARRCAEAAVARGQAPASRCAEIAAQLPSEERTMA